MHIFIAYHVELCQNGFNHRSASLLNYKNRGQEISDKFGVFLLFAEKIRSSFNPRHFISLYSGKYCHMFLCVHCLKENVACTQNGQCCKGQCVYGRCKKEGANGKPGTFCDRHEDCTDPAGTCCVR